jgi:hypothetical protein
VVAVFLFKQLDLSFKVSLVLVFWDRQIVRYTSSRQKHVFLELALLLTFACAQVAAPWETNRVAMENFRTAISNMGKWFLCARGACNSRAHPELIFVSF